VQAKVSKHAKQTAPLLIRVEEKAGHGAGLPLSKRIVEQADTIAFMARVLGATGKF
jgi:prolyl oligopeptidase